MQNIYLMESLAAQRRTQRLAEAERHRLARSAAASIPQMPIGRRLVGPFAASVGWISRRITNRHRAPSFN
ncbi:MAG TPA: hypothetical protein VGP33_10970 [Chloroflexota bacterium]|jgi:hypothetical protein|nr:hypothetical protein [Chloroflexota bacterium]